MNFAPHIQVFIVGGYVRDRLLGRECKDHDFVVVGATPDEMLDMGFQKVGADFPVFLHPLTGDEFALARTERKVGAGYNGFETEFGTDVTLEDDLARRDLTINSMAREVVGWNDLGHAKLSDDIVDPFRGQEDLRDGVLRHTTDAFAEDPLRVLRVARFRARFGWTVHHQTLELMEDLVTAGEMESLTTERVWVELEKSMTEDHPHLFFSTLRKVGAQERLFPGLDGTDFTHDSTVRLPVAAKFMVLFRTAPLELLDSLKAPTDVKRRVRKLQTVDAATLDTREAMLALLKSVDAFRNDDDNLLLVDVLDATRVGNLLHRSLRLTRGVNFASLTQEQRDTLKGKEVGEALDQLRLELIDLS